jgi:hypothetical protein
MSQWWMLRSGPQEAKQVRELQAISELTARVADPADPLRATLMAGIAESSGLHPLSLDRLVTMWVAGWQRVDLERAFRRGLGAHPGAFRPIGTVAIVAPGNLCVATWQAIAEAILAGNYVTVRPGSGDRLAAGNFREALRQVDAHLANRMEIQDFARNDRAAWLEWLARADALVVYGGDAAIAAVLRLAGEAGFTGRLRLHGHYESFGVLATEVLADPHALRTAAAGWAVDALLADGRGCMSLRALWLVGPVRDEDRQLLQTSLAAAFGRAAELLPAGQLDPGWQARGRLETETHAFAAAQHGDRWLVRGDDWTILGHHGAIAEGAPALGPGARTLAVYEAADAPDLQRQLLPWRRKLSTASVSLDADRDNVLNIVERLGVQRTCQPGAMQAPRADRAPDGHMPLAALVRLTDRV